MSRLFVCHFSLFCASWQNELADVCQTFFRTLAWILARGNHETCCLFFFSGNICSYYRFLPPPISRIIRLTNRSHLSKPSIHVSTWYMKTHSCGNIIFGKPKLKGKSTKGGKLKLPSANSSGFHRRSLVLIMLNGNNNRNALATFEKEGGVESFSVSDTRRRRTMSSGRRGLSMGIRPLSWSRMSHWFGGFIPLVRMPNFDPTPKLVLRRKSGH